ncbi:lymphotoxin-alpha [Nothobranchius furzeri]|uniref:Fas ligand (TNF superfamily, member 6) n=4 Tax=Nothobranchius TaxID=28779 RepID=A0A1A7ZT22_NOTFU|nr:tumor necrosis factor ligand superfamily member 15-like [Nothobranchius furzeri]
MEPESDSLLLICDWEAGVEMELDNVYRPEYWVPDQLRTHRTQGRRTKHFVVACLLVLIVEVPVVLLVVSYGRSCRTSPDSQTVVQPDSISLGKLQQVSSAPGGVKETPRAMLTAPEIPDISNKQLQWESNMGNAFCKGGFNYTDGHLVVPRAGYYRVFLQITYGDQGGDADTHCKNRETLKLSHSVSYFHDSYPDYQPLLSAVDTVICAQGWRKSLFTSGLFHLDKDSVLKVESEQPKRIVRNEHEVFFGAELLPDSR